MNPLRLWDTLIERIVARHDRVHAERLAESFRRFQAEMAVTNGDDADA